MTVRNGIPSMITNIIFMIFSRNDTLLDCRSLVVAQQLTFLDQKLFQAVDIVELLWWSQEQDEKKCPNLVAFTAHFNKVSFINIIGKF